MLDLTPQEKDLAQEIAAHWSAAESHHTTFARKCDHMYGLWAGYTSWKNEMAQANPRDRDVGLVSAKREWGAELFIPIVFGTVESVIPRMLSNRPKMLILPTDFESERNVENMKYLIDRQQEQIDYELVCQDVAKDGQVYGLGVQKTYWKTKRVAVPTLERGVYDPDQWLPVAAEMRTTFDDPWAEAIDPRDFVWDPYGYDIDSCTYVFHRTWRPTRYVMRMIEAGVWLAGHEGVTVDDIRGLNNNRWSETRAAQLRASGYNAPTSADGEQPHEVWEFHDGERVVTVLDRNTPVQAGANPTPRGEKPFQAFRPSKRPSREMAGMGIVEPTEDLQREMNTLRSQRRDNATLKLQQVFAYAQGLVEPEDLKFGPGMAIPVNGDPRELLLPVNVGDIPNSGYLEEEHLLQDMARASGMDDSSQGLSVGQATATEVQYVQAAASLRIQMQTRRFEVEVIKRGAQQWVWMNQIRIRGLRMLRIPTQQPAPDQPNRWWQTVVLTPEELMGEFAVDVDGGSTQPDNVPQKRSDGVQLWQMMAGNPNVNQQMLTTDVLDRFDIKAPNEWLSVAPHIPPTFLPLLEQALGRNFHLDPAMIQQLIAQVMQAATQQERATLQNPNGPSQVQSSAPPALQSGDQSGPQGE